MGRGSGLKQASRHGGQTRAQKKSGLNQDQGAAEAARKRFNDTVSQGVVRGVVSGEDLTPNPQTKHKPGSKNAIRFKRSRVSKIVAGGQSGVDQAALDLGRELGVEIGGWCPKDGWAENHTSSPGLLAAYPGMQETESAKVEQRTQWNVRDSDATLIFVGENLSSGTNLTADTAVALGLPYKVFEMKDDPKEVRDWLDSLDNIEVLNIAGPRESENPGTHDKMKQFLHDVVFKHHS